MTTTQTDHNNLRVMLWGYLQAWMNSQAGEEAGPIANWTHGSENLLRAAEVNLGESAKRFEPPGSTEQVPAAASTTSSTPPKQERRRMSRLMTVLVVVGLVLAALGGYWFATEGYTIQSPISEFNIEFQSPIVAPDSNDNPTGSESGNTDPENDQTGEQTAGEASSSPDLDLLSGSENPWDCTDMYIVLPNGKHRHTSCELDP